MKANIKWLDNPEVFRINQMDAHSDHNYFVDYAELESGNNKLLQSLNGQWDFQFSINAMERPEDFYQVDYDRSSFDKIMVPGHIELAGYDQIRYINTLYPWEGKKYLRGAHSIEGAGDGVGMFSEAEYNPVGSYVKTFDLDSELVGKRISICFEGVEEAMYVWLNGEFIGYAEDSFTPSEFDLTPYIKEKNNVLAVQVHKMSTASFLEDQDFFRFFGIFRNVTLKAIPDTHVQDMWIQPILNKDNASGKIMVDVKVTSVAESAKSVKFILADKAGNKLLCENITLADASDIVEGTITVDVEKAIPWDNHNPYLYDTYIELYENDQLVEVVPYKVGFRRLEIIDKVMHLNGKRLILVGVNRHEWNAKTGRVIGMEEMISDMECVKKNNINSVRTCH